MKFTKTVKRILVSVFSALFCVALGLFFSVGSVFTAKAAETVTTTKNMTCNGASIRLVNDKKSGIRFHVRVQLDENGKVTFDKEYTKADFLGLRSGILLIPSNKLSDGEELTLEGATNEGRYASGAKAANVTGEDCVWKYNQAGNYYEATAYIYNIPDTSYEKDFTFRGYCIGENGTTYYTENTNNTRSVSYVALQAKIDDVDTKDKSGETAGYQDDLLTQLNGFLPKDLVNTDKFANKETYLYRLGNLNTVKLSSLFDMTDLSAYGVGNDIANLGENTADFIKWENVLVTAECAYTLNTDNLKNTELQFTGTGVIKMSIPDFAKYTRSNTETGNTTGRIEMLFEVVNAKNATSAMSATANNVVLLNDVGLSTISVGGGWTLYGNGFKMTAVNDVLDHKLASGFVSLDGGTLDNVQIICPNFSYTNLYSSYMVGENASENYYDSKQQNYGNVRSAVLVSAINDNKATLNTIVNCYISGGRAAVYANSGHLNLDNTTVDGGAAANVYVGSSATLTLKNATLIQEPKQATVYDTSKKLMGFSVLAECDDDNTPAIKLEGKFTQYAWVNETYAQYAPSNSETIVNTVLSQDAYKHDITYADGVTCSSVNLGIAYVNLGDSGKAPEPGNISDKRDDTTTIPYKVTAVSANVLFKRLTAYVYSYTNSNGTADAFKTIPPYTSNAQSFESVLPTVSYSKTNQAIVAETIYTEDIGWNTTVTCDLDNGARNQFFDFSSITVKKYGQTLDYDITNENGTTADTTSIQLKSPGEKKYVLTITDNQVYDANGEELSPIVRKYYFTLIITGSKIADPIVTAEPGGEALLVVKSKNSDWSCAIPALEETKIKYYAQDSGNYEELVLAELTPQSTGKKNGTNNYWEYTSTTKGFKLKVTCGYIHEGKQVYGMPVVVNNNGYKMYFTISSTNGYVSTSTTAREVTLTYEFTDCNSTKITFTKTWQFTYADYKNGAQYKYSDFVSGKLNDLNSSSGDSGGDSCVTADTLITLADGSQVRVDALTGNEQLLVWNMETGMLDSAPIMFNDSESATEVEIIHLYFSDGTEVNVISEHGFWDYDLNRYVYLDNKAAEYIGHTFAKQDGDSLSKVQLVDVVLEYDVATAWSPVTVGHLCYFVNGMLSMPGGVGGLFNIFDVDAETMTYDYEAIARDIETYGLFTYEELNAIVELPESMFNEAGGAYLKISIAKGNMTMDELITMINRYKHFYE